MLMAISCSTSIGAEREEPLVPTRNPTGGSGRAVRRLVVDRHLVRRRDGERRGQRRLGLTGVPFRDRHIVVGWTGWTGIHAENSEVLPSGGSVAVAVMTSPADRGATDRENDASPFVVMTVKDSRSVCPSPCVPEDESQTPLVNSSIRYV